MTATNHALTGALIGLTVNQPAVAILAALLSHFVLDALPHFGSVTDERVLFKTKTFRNYLIAEAIICFLIVSVLFATHPKQWQLASICAFIAAAPDLLSINHYLTVKTGRIWKPNLYSRFASRIQWFERPIGGFVEVAWALCAVILLATIIQI